MGPKYFLFFHVLLLLQDTNLGRVGAFEIVKFLTDAFYKDSILEIRPFVTREIKTLTQCQALCATQTSCQAFAFGGLCVSQCRLYDSNLCINANIKVTVNQKSFIIWDKVDIKTNFSCYTDRSFKSCLKSQFGRCGACKRDGYHGPNCEFASRGCPNKYEFHNGSCSYVSSTKVDFQTVAGSCAANGGGRFGLVRNDYANSMLQTWAIKLGLGDGIYIGVEKSNGGWMRKDGQLLNNDSIYANWWLPNQPSESVQSVAVMAKDMGFRYNDDLDFVLRNYFCEVAAENCTAFSMQINDTDGTCYNLHQQKANFTNAKLACENENGTLAKVRDLQTHEMLVNFTRRMKVDADIYVGILASKRAPNKGTYHDGTAINFALPWEKDQPNFTKESVVLLTNNGKWNDVLKTLPNGYFCEFIATSCSEWQRYGLQENGLYRLLPKGTLVDFVAYCDMSSAEGWTVIQKRSRDDSVNFNRTFEEYETGFGNLVTDFWLGLEKITLLTSQEAVHLSIEMVDINNVRSSIIYSGFKLVETKSADRYMLIIGEVVSNATSGSTAVDGLSTLNGTIFMAYDSEMDHNCASAEGGGWWFLPKCGKTNLNGFYSVNNKSKSDTVMQWEGTPLAMVQMKIKPSAYFEN